MIIAFTAASSVHPMIRGSYKGNEIVQSTFSIHSVMTPFSNIIRAFFISPLMAKSCQSRVVIVHCDKRATRSRESIRSTTEVLDHSFAFGISGRSDVECSSRSLFLAKESYLSERQDFSQLFHGRCCEKNLFAAYSTVWILHWQTRRVSWAAQHKSWDEKPTTWNHTRFRFVMSANKPAIPIVPARNAKLIGLYQFKKNSREFSKFSSKITYLHPLTNCNIEVFEKFA